MRRRARQTRSLVAAATATAVLLLAGCSEDPDVPAAEQTPRPLVSPNRLDVADSIPQDAPLAQIVNLNVSDGEVTGETGLVDVRADSLVQVVVVADVLDEVVVEGYGLSFRTEVGRPVMIEFPADMAGQYDVSLRRSGLQLTTLDVE